jgi:hypothetical protein
MAMILGTVQNGVIVLNNDQTLPEGTVVQVAPQRQPAEDEASKSIGQLLADHYLYGVPKKP